MGGAHVQPLTPTPLEHFGTLKGVGGARLQGAGGSAKLESRVPQYRYFKAIPLPHRLLVIGEKTVAKQSRGAPKSLCRYTQGRNISCSFFVNLDPCP